MVNVIKVCFGKNGVFDKQIRRVAVSSDLIGSFRYLEKKVQEIFPLLQGKSIEIQWKDSDNDFIIISSDEELAQAIANMEEGLLKLFVHEIEDHQSEIAKESKKRKRNEENSISHPGVVCDGCEDSIRGDRYKCLQCRDFDLCSTCNNNNKHPDHDFVKIVKPAHIPREWVFLGSRKIWKSMFHPMKFNFHSKNMGDKKAKVQKDNQSFQNDTDVNIDMNIFTETMKGNFHEAQKMLSDILQGTLNLQDIEIKLGGCPEFKYTPHNEKEMKSNVDNSKASCSSTSNEQKGMDMTSDMEAQASNVDKDDTLLSSAGDIQNQEAEVIYVPVAGDANFNSKNISENPQTGNQNTFAIPLQMNETVTGDGWTILQNDTTHESQMNVRNPDCAIADAFSDVNSSSASVYPNLEQHVSDTNEIEEITPALDPQVINGLDAMKSMGFTDENGWLTHLLMSKNGNVNAVLDALYPGMN